MILIATSAPGGVTGPYRLTIERTAQGADTSSNPAEQHLSGNLEAGDETLDSGSFVDIFELKGTPGEELTVDLTSASFDPILFAMDGNGDVLETNDDFEGSTSRSL